MRVKLGDVCEVLNGYAFKSSKYVDEGIRIIRITNVQKGYIEDTDPKYYPYKFKEEISNYLLHSDDLLISLTGNVGRVAIIKSNMLPAALNQRVACLRIKNESRLLKRFLFHILNSDSFEQQCILSSNGVAQKNMSTEWLKDYEINDFTIEEQTEITLKLDKVDALIMARKAQLEKFNQLIKSRFIELKMLLSKIHYNYFYELEVAA